MVLASMRSREVVLSLSEMVIELPNEGDDENVDHESRRHS